MFKQFISILMQVLRLVEAALVKHLIGKNIKVQMNFA